MRNWKYIDGAEGVKIGNGSGSWRGNFYEDSAGNSATVMKSGNGWEVVWEDFRGHGKSVGVYKDQNTAKKVAEEVVESEMPDRIKANYRSQTINSIPDSQINGPSAAEIREIAGRVYKTDMRKDDLARAVSFELAKKYKSFQTNSHIMDMVSEVLSKFKIGNSTVGNSWDRAYYKQMIDPAKWDEFSKKFEKLAYAQDLERYDIEDRMALKPELRSEKYKIIERQRHDMEALVNKYKKIGNETMHEWATSKPKSVGNSAYDDGVKKGKEDKRNGKLITAAGFDMHVPGFSKYSYQEREEFKKGYYSSNDLTKDDIYKSWKTGNAVPDAWSTIVVPIKETITQAESAKSYCLSERADHKNAKRELQNAISSAKKAIDGIDKYDRENSKTGNSDREFFKELADDAKEREEKYDADIEKVGNKTYKVKESSGHDGGYDYGYIVVDESNRSVGRTFSTRSEAEEYIRELYKKEKVGNKEYSTDDFKRIKEEALRIAQTTKDEEKKKRALKIADYMKYAHNQPDWGKIVDRYDQELKQIGNSASDDKFAYVMREFDEGKLKTPDGKVVTDPAQAKAIAYSESKKTENGLARARNAMAKNKKVKNSAVREYKHSDGRVAQIDFNEDGSDADMSIYEGTREIEQRNFSTIRDAEQYVTSHGFRRI